MRLRQFLYNCRASCAAVSQIRINRLWIESRFLQQRIQITLEACRRENHQWKWDTLSQFEPQTLNITCCRPADVFSYHGEEFHNKGGVRSVFSRPDALGHFRQVSWQNTIPCGGRHHPYPHGHKPDSKQRSHFLKLDFVCLCEAVKQAHRSVCISGPTPTCGRGAFGSCSASTPGSPLCVTPTAWALETTSMFSGTGGIFLQQMGSTSTNQEPDPLC